MQRGRILCSGEVSGGVWFCRLGYTVTHTSKEKDKVERVNRRAARMVSNDYGRHSSVTSMLTRLGWATLEQRRENQWLTMMYKVVHGLVAVPTTHLTAADFRTRANHSYKFRTISCNYALQVFLLSANHSFLEPPSSRNRRSYVRRCIQASSSVVPPFISIGVISLLGVCRLLSRSRSLTSLRPHLRGDADLEAEVELQNCHDVLCIVYVMCIAEF